MQNDTPIVLHVLDHSLPHVSGYSVRSHYILRAQLRNGVQAVVLTSPKHGPCVGDEQIEGVTYQRVPTGRVRRSRSIPGADEVQVMHQLRARLVQVVREQHIDLIHAHSPALNGIPALSVGRRAGVPVVYEIRALWEDAAVAYRGQRRGSVRYRGMRALETWLLRRVDAVGVISQGLAGDVIGRGIPPQKVFLVPNGVDTERFQPLERDVDLATQLGLEGQIVIGFIGTIYRYEGLEVLVQALARIDSPVPRVCALLVGEGPECARLGEQARRLGIASRVTLVGEIPHADIRRWYSVCDVLVYPRHSTRLTELTTPLKPLEAMAMSKAVVGGNVGGLRELIQDGETGMLFPAGDAGALAALLARLIHDDELRATLGRRARSFVCTQRQWQHAAQAAIGTYRTLLDHVPQEGRDCLRPAASTDAE